MNLKSYTLSGDLKTPLSYKTYCRFSFDLEKHIQKVENYKWILYFLFIIIQCWFKKRFCHLIYCINRLAVSCHSNKFCGDIKVLYINIIFFWINLTNRTKCYCVFTVWISYSQNKLEISLPRKFSYVVIMGKK